MYPKTVLQVEPKHTQNHHSTEKNSILAPSAPSTSTLTSPSVGCSALPPTLSTGIAALERPLLSPSPPSLGGASAAPWGLLWLRLRLGDGVTVRADVVVHRLVASRLGATFYSRKRVRTALASMAKAFLARAIMVMAWRAPPAVARAAVNAAVRCGRWLRERAGKLRERLGRADIAGLWLVGSAEAGRRC